MNKTELIKYVSDKTRITQVDAEIIIDVVFQGCRESLMDGKRVKIRDFGSLIPVQRKARKAINPNSGEEMTIPAKMNVKFDASKMLLDMVNGHDRIK